jgi:hypothetical protein
METMIAVPTYCGVEVTKEYSTIPQFWFNEVENYFTNKWCCDSVLHMFENNFIMGICSTDTTFDNPGVLRKCALFLCNRVPKYNSNGDKYFGDKETVREFLNNGTPLTREDLIQTYGLG